MGGSAEHLLVDHPPWLLGACGAPRPGSVAPRRSELDLQPARHDLLKLVVVASPRDVLVTCDPNWLEEHLARSARSQAWVGLGLPVGPSCDLSQDPPFELFVGLLAEPLGQVSRRVAWVGPTVMSAAFEQVGVPSGTPQPGGMDPQGVVVAADPAASWVGASALMLVGLCTILVSAWGGIAPYVGPLFGYAATGTPAWHWNLSHAVLALAPGGLGVLCGLSMMSSASRVRAGLGRASLALAGFVAIVAGGWFVIGPDAWPLLVPGAHYFTAASPFHGLMDRLGSTFGPGVLLAALGAFNMGWALRHRPLTAVRQNPATVPVGPDGATSPATSSGPRHLR